MAEILSEINEAQNFWLRLQGHVVELSEKRSNQLNSIHLNQKRKSSQRNLYLHILSNCAP